MAMNEADFLQEVLSHLKALVAFDTQNPPRDIQAEGGIIGYLQDALPGFEFKLYDAGNGCMGLLATRGVTDRLYNFHIDTVPVAPNWQRNPFALTIEGDKAYGLGSCDIKGASACMLVAAKYTESPLALLFSTDEEHGSSLAVKTFLEQNQDYQEVIVSEPTLTKATLAHRGIQSGKVSFFGVSGHGSQSRAISDNAIHKHARWLSAVLEWVEGTEATFQNLSGFPFNSGKIDGGIKANMIAANSEMTFGFRPLPGMDSAAMIQTMRELGYDLGYTDDDFTIEPAFFGPTLPAANQPFDTAYESAQQLAASCGLTVGPAVDFWTEASLFSQAGMTALVYGPGDIAQAHTADEWVELAQLEQVAKQYITMINAQ